MEWAEKLTTTTKTYRKNRRKSSNGIYEHQGITDKTPRNHYPLFGGSARSLRGHGLLCLIPLMCTTVIEIIMIGSVLV